MQDAGEDSCGDRQHQPRPRQSAPFPLVGARQQQQRLPQQAQAQHRLQGRCRNQEDGQPRHVAHRADAPGQRPARHVRLPVLHAQEGEDEDEHHLDADGERHQGDVARVRHALPFQERMLADARPAGAEAPGAFTQTAQRRGEAG